MAQKISHTRIVEKYYNGDPLSDSEVIEGERHFKGLSVALVTCGPVFHLAFKEANGLYIAFSNFRAARDLPDPCEEG